MRNLLTGLTVAAALAFASSSQANDGLVDMSWNGCTPIVQNLSTTTPGAYSLYISVIGFDQPHQAYETTFIYGDASGNVPDSWRFDPAGCQGSSFVTIDHLAPAAVSKTCPTFQGALASVQVKDVGFVPPSDQGTGYLATNMRVSLYNAYPPGIPATVGTTRYFLERVLFDHTFSVQGATTPGVDCGNWANAICFKMIRAHYLLPPDNPLDIPFGRDNGGPGLPLFVTFNDPTFSSCSAVPSKPATWGAIKNQYRN
jgi:hypothetical protein